MHGGIVNRTIEKASLGLDHRDATLATLLGRIGVEMEDASVSLRAVQDTLADLHPGCLSSKEIIGLQALDIVEQTVRALAKVVRSVSTAVGSEREIDQHAILADCEISGLAERLARPAAGDGLPHQEAGAKPSRRTESTSARSTRGNETSRSTTDVEFF